MSSYGSRGGDEYGGIDIWGKSHSESWSDIYRKTFKYEFRDEEDLITSEIFQKCLGQALAHKDRVIRELQEEILNGK